MQGGASRFIGASCAQLSELGPQVGGFAAQPIDADAVALHRLQPLHGGAQLLFQASGAIKVPAVLQPLHPLLQLADRVVLMAG